MARVLFQAWLKMLMGAGGIIFLYESDIFKILAQSKYNSVEY
jgi:hypothetical protein